MKGLLFAAVLYTVLAVLPSVKAEARPPQPPAAKDIGATTAPATQTRVKTGVGQASRKKKLENMRAAVVPANSFTPPFDEYDENTGERMVHEHWKAGGDTDVHENFVRLTNDRQSKVGLVHACCLCRLLSSDDIHT